jgi:hypothetical protein
MGGKTMRITCRVHWLGVAVLAGSVFCNIPARADDQQGENNDNQGKDLQSAPAGAPGFLQKGIAPKNDAAHGGARTNNLIDHGGPVRSASHAYFVWWGTQTDFPADAKAGLESIAQGMNGSGYLGIMNQYMRGAGISTAYVSAANDTSAPPSGSPSVSTIVNEACQAINANGWATDSNALYTVVTSNFPGNVNFCAWHSHGTCNGKDIQVAYLPNTTGIAGCDPGNNFSCNLYSQGTRSLANVYAHEFAEAITDPDLNAWYDRGGSEIGDKCSWTFSACVVLSNGKWQLQREWSNSISGCAQQ